MHYHQTSSEKSAKASISVSMVSIASVVAQVAEQQLELGRAWFESRVELGLFRYRELPESYSINTGDLAFYF